MLEEVKTLNDVLEPYAGQIVSCEQDHKVYRWNPIAGWELFKFNGDIKMSAYEMNQQIMGQLEILDETTIQEKKKMVREFVNSQPDTFFMLLCRDINYYTVFFRTSTEIDVTEDILEDVLIDECLNFIGDIKAIDMAEDGRSIECWLQNGDKVYAAYFFPYDLGVVVCA